MEMLLCYEDEGVYVNTYGRIIKDVVLQWGEMPTSVGESGGGVSAPRQPPRGPRTPGGRLPGSEPRAGGGGCRKARHKRCSPLRGPEFSWGFLPVQSPAGSVQQETVEVAFLANRDAFAQTGASLPKALEAPLPQPWEGALRPPLGQDCLLPARG